jgi:hypothetical protein
MAYTLQSAAVSCAGGLDLRSTVQELYSRPGFATKLRNMECSHLGGYRRINGFTPFEGTQVPGEGIIKGIYLFNETLLVARGSDLYHTFDGETWVQVNKVGSSMSFGDIESNEDVYEFEEEAKKFNFASSTNGTVANDYYVTIVNGYDWTCYFEIKGTSHLDAEYTFTPLDPDTTSALPGCKYVYHFKDQVYLSGNRENPSLVAVSSLFDPTNYSGTSSLAISTAQKVTGLRPFRENMVVFCENSIFSLTGVAEANPSLVPISRNIGCISGESIQEINGDLIYLARDGLRNLAATERIGDVELSSVSVAVQRLVSRIVDRLNEYEITSTVLRGSNQYRLYYTPISETIPNAKGIIGTILPGQQGSSWGWAEYEGPKIYNVFEDVFAGDYQSFCSIEHDGLLYRHNVGNTFKGAPIKALYQTPLFHLGDGSLRKNIHRVRTYVSSENMSRVFFDINYRGYQNDNELSPAAYDLGFIVAASNYGEDEYSDAIYAASDNVSTVVNTEGSGFTMWFRYSSNSVSDSSYTIQGFEVDFKVSGKT